MLWVLLVFVVILAGLIAYTADNVARRVGRRHIRLFGLRPKTTALIYAVVTGMGISLLSMLGFALINKQAIQTINKAEEYRDEVQLLKTQITPLRKNKAQLEVALKDTQANVVRISKDRSQALKARDDLKKEADGLRAEVNELKEYRVALEAQNQKHSSRADQLFQQGQVLEQSIRELEIKSTTLESQNKNLKASYNRMVKDLDTERDQYQQIQTQYQNTQQEYQQAKAEVQKAKTESQKARQQSMAAQKQLLLIDATLGKLRKEQVALKKEQSSLKKEQSSLKKENETLKKARMNAQGELNGLQYLRAQLIKESEELKKDNEQLRASVKQLTQESGLLKTEANQLKVNLDQQRTELEARRTQDAIYQKGDLVYQGIYLAEDGRDILNRAIRQAEIKAVSRGAKGKPNAVLAPAEQLTELTQNLKNLDGEVLVMVRATTNQIRGFPVSVEVQLLENKVFFSREQPIRSKLVALGDAGVKTNRELSGALQTLALEAVEALQEKGIPLENLPDGLSTADTVSMINSLKNLKGNVMVGIMSRTDIKPGAKVTLYPRILR